MRKVLLSLLFLIACYYSFGQIVAVSADRNNIAYIGMDNPITIAAENHSSKSLIITTDNGTISGQDGRYIYKPKSIGKASIYVQLNKGGKASGKMWQYDFRVKYYFDKSQIRFAIGSLYGDGIIKMKQLLSQEYVRAVVEDTDMNATCEVERFSVYIYKKDSVVLKYNVSSKISEEIKNEFQQLTTGDILLFRDIIVNSGDGRQLTIYPLMLTVKE